MNAEVKQKWIAALLSGNYEQGKNRLKVEFASGKSQYCCLGVLCDISGLGEWKFSPTCVGFVYAVEGDTPNPAALPDLVASWAGVKLLDMTDLIGKNDSGETFQEIAEYINRWL